MFHKKYCQSGVILSVPRKKALASSKGQEISINVFFSLWRFANALVPER